MHPEPTQHELDMMRWLDGEMSPAESAQFEQTMAADAALSAEARALQEVSRSLQHYLPKAELKNADFFNHQIQQAIAAEQRAAAPAVRTAASPSIWSWLRTPWALGAAAAVIAVATVAWPQSRVSQIVGSYAPNPGIKVDSYYDSSAGATVLLLQGLDAMPAEKPLVGYHNLRSETDAELAQTTLFDEAGQVVAVVAQNSRNEPVIITR